MPMSVAFLKLLKAQNVAPHGIFWGSEAVKIVFMTGKAALWYLTYSKSEGEKQTSDINAYMWSLEKWYRVTYFKAGMKPRCREWTYGHGAGMGWGWWGGDLG